MEKRFWEFKIPTWGAFLVLAVSIWASVYLLQSTLLSGGRASSDTEPQQIKVVNVTDSSFTVSFVTASPTSAAIRLVTTSRIVQDSQNGSTGRLGNYYSHLITVSNLSPATTYSYSILSNGTTFDNNGHNYQATTATSVANSQTTTQVHGVILLPNGMPATDTLVYLSIPGAQNLATITDNQGSYTFLLSHLLSEELNVLAPINNQTHITVQAYQGELSSTVTTVLENALSLPTITLSNDYDFTQTSQVTQNSVSPGFNIPPVSKSNGSVSIVFPQNSQSLTDDRPIFRGTARPLATVSITIHSDAAITTQVTADSNGFWAFRPAVALSPGQHTVTIQSVNMQGITKSVTQAFSVFASGAQIAQIVPSASPTQATTPPVTLAPTATMTPSPAISAPPPPTLQPTVPQPTIQAVTPLVFDTSTPTPTINTVTGTNTPIILTSVAVIFIVAGTTLLFVL